MFALRQSYDHAPPHIAVPKELQTHPIELIFLSADEIASPKAISHAGRRELLKAAMETARGCLDTGLTIDQMDAEVRAMRNEWL